jgi:hypothetical protein
MSPKATRNAPPPRKSRPRQSCHDCFKAKVKCDKERPGCTRCVTIGRDCGYVDYDQDGNVVVESPAAAAAVAYEPQNLMAVPHSNDEFHPALVPALVGSGQAGWDLGTTAMIAGDGNTMAVLVSGGIHAGTNPTVTTLPTGLAWQQAVHPAEFLDHRTPIQPSSAGGPPYQFSPGTDASLLHSPFAPDLTGLDIYHSEHPPFANLPAQPGGWPAQPPPLCGCLSHCLKGLQQLELASTEGLLHVDEILALCLEALAACSALLACGACRQSAGPQSTTATLLATVLERVAGLYLEVGYLLAPVGSSIGGTADAPGGAPGAGGGEYDRSAHAELLARHLVRLDRVCGMYAGVFGGLGDGGGAMDEMMGSLVERLKALRAVCDWTELAE